MITIQQQDEELRRKQEQQVQIIEESDTDLDSMGTRIFCNFSDALNFFLLWFSQEENTFHL